LASTFQEVRTSDLDCLGIGPTHDLTEEDMNSKHLILLSFSCACAAMPLQAQAFDVGGSNGISVNSGTNGGVSVSVGGSTGVNATAGGGSNVANVSVGGGGGVSANVGGTSNGGLGVDTSVGGSSGINSSTTVGGSNSSGGLGVGTTARVGGSTGVNADADVFIGGSRLATANAAVGTGDDTLLDLAIGIPAVNDPDVIGRTNPGIDVNPVGSSPAGVDRSASITMINDMSAGDRAKAKVRCKDVLKSSGYEASLVSLCKMVVAMR
jgi:hypothetical protein